MTKKDEWLKAALTDDEVVVELLFRLKGSSFEPSMPSLPPVSWGLRLPRSKLPNTFRKYSTTTRCSPKTPLSWSCTAGASGSDGGHDDTSANCASSDPFRSKGTFTSEMSNICRTNQSTRKKKKFSKLIEDENILMDELESINVKQRARSKNVKRIKIDLNQESGESGAKLKETQAQVVVSNKCKIKIEASTTSSCIVDEDQRCCFVLPDLNMMPTEDEIPAKFCN